MYISKETLISSLRRAIPMFEPNPEWVDNQLGYPIINDLARYTCEQAKSEQFDEVQKVLAFLETSIEAGDPYIEDLALEYLETLLSCERIAAIKTYFGPQALARWNKHFQGIYESRAGGGAARHEIESS